jgi:DNA-binding HxlR family transcriptional regulator
MRRDDRSMADYGRYCPISLGSEVLADRWTPLILREPLIGSTRFNDIARGMPGISRTLLVQRLRHLERMGCVELWPSRTGRGSEYHLTPAGKGLEPVIDAIGHWAIDWMFEELDPDDVDAVNLLWWMHRHVATDRLPSHRVTLQFDHTAPERTTIWLVLDRGEASVCIQHPGFDPDVVITSTTPALAKVFAGIDTWAEAVAAQTVRIDGPPTLVKGLHRWLLPSAFAPRIRAQAEAAAAPAR